MDLNKEIGKVGGLEDEEIGPGRNDRSSTHFSEDEYQQSKLITPDSPHNDVGSSSLGIHTQETTARQNDSTEDRTQRSGIGKSDQRPGNNVKTPSASTEFNFDGHPQRSTTPVCVGKGKPVQASNKNATNPRMALEVMGDYYKTAPTDENESKRAPFYNRCSNNGAHHGPSDESIYIHRNDIYGERERSILQEVDTNDCRRLLDDAMWLASKDCAKNMLGAGNTTIRESKSSRSVNEKSSYSSMTKPNCRRPWVNRAYGSGNRAYNKNRVQSRLEVHHSGDDRNVIDGSVWPTIGEASDSAAEQPSSTPEGSYMESRSDTMTKPNYRRPWVNRAHSGANRAYNKNGVHIHRGVEQSGHDSVGAPDSAVDQSSSTGSSQMKRSSVNSSHPWLDQTPVQLDDSWPTAMTHVGDPVESLDAPGQELLGSESHQKMNTSGDMRRMSGENHGVVAGSGRALDTAADESWSSAFPCKEVKTLGEMMKLMCEMNERRANRDKPSGKSRTQSQASSVSDVAEVNLAGIRAKYRDYRETVGPHDVERARANIAYGHFEHERIKERLAKRRPIRKHPSFDDLEIDTDQPNWIDVGDREVHTAQPKLIDVVDPEVHTTQPKWIDVGDPEVHTLQPKWIEVQIKWTSPNPDITSDDEDLDSEP